MCVCVYVCVCGGLAQKIEAFRLYPQIYLYRG